jgi:putative DNA primase/helicase
LADSEDWMFNEPDPWDSDTDTEEPYPADDLPDPQLEPAREKPPPSEPAPLSADGLPELAKPTDVYRWQRSADDGRWVDLAPLDENDKLVAGVPAENLLDGCQIMTSWADITPLKFDQFLQQELPGHKFVYQDPLERIQRPEIFAESDILAVAQQVISVLGSEPDPQIYRRNGMLVDVVHNDAGKPIIRQTPLAHLRAVISSVVVFKKRTSDGNKLTKCPEEVVKAVMDRGQWPAIKPIDGVVCWPTIRRDGRVLAGFGYDPHSRLLCEAKYDVPHKKRKTHDDARLGLQSLKDLVSDFPFVSPAHRSAWLAFLITMTCRHAIEGPVPLMLIDATSMGSGKTLLADLVWTIVAGERVARSVIPSTDEEWGKTLVSIAIGAQPLVLFDNLTRRLKSEALDAVLTGTSFGGRLLATNQDQRFSTPTVFCITANNAQTSSDLVRRSLHIRIAPDEERPELRSTFRYPDILAHALKHRHAYHDHALSLIRAYVSAGKPPVDLQAMGSFERWSDLVRSALVWAGEPDPVSTQEGLRESADGETEDLRAFLEAWNEEFGTRPQTTKDLLLNDGPVRSAADDLIRHTSGPLKPRDVSFKLRAIKGKPIGGLRIELLLGSNGKPEKHRLDGYYWVLVKSDG